MNEMQVPAKPGGSSHASQFEVAYDRLEELLVNGTLRPGSRLSIQDLQAACGFGRTPVYQAAGSYTHLRAPATVLDLVCPLLL